MAIEIVLIVSRDGDRKRYAKGMFAEEIVDGATMGDKRWQAVIAEMLFRALKDLDSTWDDGGA